MKKSLRKKLNNELDFIIPDLPKSVVDAPITVADVTEKPKKSGIKEFFTKLLPTKKARRIFSTALACFMAILVAVPFMVPKGGDGTVVLVEINPSVRLMSTDGDKVSGVVSNNADGDVILYDEEFYNSLKGKSIQDAINSISYKAVEYGYIQGSDTENHIKISVLKDNLQKADETANQLQDELIDFLCDKGVFAFVEGEEISSDDYSQKFGFDISKVKDAISEIKKLPPLTLDTSFTNREDMLDKYNALYQAFLEDAGTEIGNIHERYADLMVIGLQYGQFRDMGITDPFDKDLNLIEPLASMYKDFLEKVDAFNQKYGEVLTEERFVELSKLKEIFDAIGEAPSSPEDFVEKMKAILFSRANAFKDGAREFFNAERPKITKEQYNEYVKHYFGERP